MGTAGGCLGCGAGGSSLTADDAAASSFFGGASPAPEGAFGASFDGAGVEGFDPGFTGVVLVPGLDPRPYAGGGGGGTGFPCHEKHSRRSTTNAQLPGKALQDWEKLSYCDYPLIQHIADANFLTTCVHGALTLLNTRDTEYSRALSSCASRFPTILPLVAVMVALRNVSVRAFEFWNSR